MPCSRPRSLTIANLAGDHCSTSSIAMVKIKSYLLLLLFCVVSIRTEEVNSKAPTSTSENGGIQECFKKDSISCVQMHIYRGVKSFFNQEDIELFGGFSLTKEKQDSESTGRSSGNSAIEQQLLESNDVEERENALESFTVEKAMTFFEGRSLKFNLSPVVTELKSTARAAIDSIPSDVRKRITEFLTEGRGKKKKLLKTLLPILIGAKVKIAALIALAYLGIALIAKKAILASLISIAISAFIGIRKLLAQQQQQHHHPHHEVHEAIPIHSGWSGGHGVIGGGYSAGGGSFDTSGYGGHGEYGSHSSPIGHSIAYSAHKPVRR